MEVKDGVIDNNATYNKTIAVSVRFNTKMDASLGPIVVYINPVSKQVLGQGLRY